MNIEFISTLPVLRELYEKPRDMARFHWYLEQMIGTNEDGKQDVVIPITAANPMGREPCLAAVNALIAMDADGVGAAAAQAGADRLAGIEALAGVKARAYIGVVDDVGGAWSNRYTVEASYHLDKARGQRANQHRHFIGAVCWVSACVRGAYTPARIRAEMMAAVYRFAFMQLHGLPRTLQQMLTMEGQARVFAGLTERVLSDDDLAYTREILQPYREAADTPITFACMFGDEAARAMGYEPMGLSPYAGFALAVDEALRSGVMPEQCLVAGG